MSIKTIYICNCCAREATDLNKFKYDGEVAIQLSLHREEEVIKSFPFFNAIHNHICHDCAKAIDDTLSKWIPDLKDTIQRVARANNKGKAEL